MDALSIVALAVGALGLLGGVLWGWSASRNAARVAFKIVSASNDAKSDPQLEERVRALEAWRAQTETAGRLSAPDDA